MHKNFVSYESWVCAWVFCFCKFMSAHTHERVFDMKLASKQTKTKNKKKFQEAVMESVENLKQQTFLPTNLIRMCNIYVYICMYADIYHICQYCANIFVLIWVQEWSKQIKCAHMCLHFAHFYIHMPRTHTHTHANVCWRIKIS